MHLRVTFVLFYFLAIFLICAFLGCSDTTQSESEYQTIIEYKTRLSNPEVRHDELIEMYRELDRIKDKYHTDYAIKAMRVQVHIIDILERRDNN